MKHADIIQTLDLEQKCALLSGGTVFDTRALPGKNVPSITLSDGPNGVRKQAGAADHLGLNPSVPATCFPTSATVANSWDPALGEAVGEAMGEEAAAQEVSVLLGPGLNIKRSPLCGRNFEYFSEDPYLAGKMAAGYVRGIQKNGIAACPKHFAVNSQELRRMASDSIVDERTLREIYLTGFEIVVKEAKPKTIMSAYNLINGTYANENAHLLKDILRKDWGFEGAVVTDWGGSNDHALGVKNGSTLEMPFPGDDSVRELMKAVESGKISEADVDARLDELLELPGFMGFQTNNEVATGLGFGARKGNSVVQALLRDYDALDFLKADGSADLTPCPERNTRVLQALGVRKDGTRQSIAEMEIFPAEYFCPMDFYSRELRVTPKTYSIHRYAESWKPKPSAVSRILQRLLKKHYYTWYCPLRGRIEGRLRKRT
jgi:hypothetical protein